MNQQMNKAVRVAVRFRQTGSALVEAYEANKIILDTYGERVILKRRRDDDDDQGKEPESASAPLEPATRSAGRSTTGSKSQQASASESAFAEEPVQTTSHIKEPSHPLKKPPTPNRDWNKTLPAAQGSTQSWISDLAKQDDSRSSFNELLDTPLDFSNFIMNRLRVDTLTPELLAGPTYELMKGSCNSLTELEYHLEEGGASWRKYTTSVTKTKTAEYENIKWIEVLFYGFAVNRESALDVYSKRRIIAVTDLKIVEWHNYKHLDWISVRRDDDKIYKFKEGGFKRLRLQDIEDMLLLLVQGKLSNLTRRVEDLQLGFESYQKKLNLMKPDTYRFDLKHREAYTTYSNPRGFIYQNKDKKNRPSTGCRKLPEEAQPYEARYRSDLKHKEAYTAYSNPRGFIYQNKDKKNRLMRIDELHKFSDGTLTDVRTALDDRLKGIRMRKILPKLNLSDHRKH
nr:hypothetical protein [Tanacetum cinerariifolium]